VYDVQARGDAAGAQLRRVFGQRLEERVAPAAVALAHAPDVAVEGAGGDELGERELLEDLCVAEDALGLDDRLHETRREDEPSEPQAGRQRLARRAGVDDVLGRQPLERADRLAVVAELAVVVILDEDGAVRAGPGDERGARVGRERRAERELVGGREERRAGRARARPQEALGDELGVGLGDRPALVCA
jgi:hypothetical protein